MALAALLLLNVKIGRFCVKACKMEIINLRFAPTDLKELAAVAITGLSVKNLPFYSFSNCYYIFINYHSTSKKTFLLESLQQLCL